MNPETLMHQKLCHELMKVSKENPAVNPYNIPIGKKILFAIELLEEFYPELK